MSEALTEILIRVECVPHAPDDAGPVRLLALTSDGTTLARLTFTPTQARSTARGLARILAQFIPDDSARRIGEGLRQAAVTVWAARN